MGTKINKRAETLKEVLKSIQKQFGEGSIMQLGNTPRDVNVPSFSSGSLGLDIALGVGGYPRGRLVEIYGQIGRAHV